MYGGYWLTLGVKRARHTGHERCKRNDLIAVHDLVLDIEVKLLADWVVDGTQVVHRVAIMEVV